ncbi:hypothetical protein ACT4UM_17375, partial [Bacillus sp. SS-TM]
MMMETNTIIQGAVVDQLHKLQIPVSALTYMGSLTTERAETLFKGGTLRTGRMGVGDDAVSGIYKNSPE